MLTVLFSLSFPPSSPLTRSHVYISDTHSHSTILPHLNDACGGEKPSLLVFQVIALY